MKQTATTTLEVEDMFQGLEGNSNFSKIDLKNAFLQIPLSDSSKELTTINTMWGLFRFNFLPFGITVSPGFFQNIIDKVIAGLPGVRAYQDDLLVFATSREQHDERLLQVLSRLDEYNVKINATKSTFAVNKLEYLGYIITGNGVSPNVERVAALRSAPKPNSREKLQSFIGFLQYYGKFVPNFSSLAKPFFDLLSSGDFSWKPLHDRCYDDLLRAVIDGKVLKSFRVGLPCELIVDASDYGLGAILEQNGHPVICISRQLSKSESGYSQTQKEALAIHWAVRRLHKYLFGHHFKIVTDHKALEYMLNPSSSLTKTTSAMLQRWALELAAYSYSIEHRPGKRIPHADYFSRYAKQEPPEENVTLLVNPLPLDRNKLIEETKLA
jgi:hypothetical protein